MKELFSQAIQKMKRKDFLDDVVREKTAEGNSLTQELSLLRKKNGSRSGGELDLKIYQINAKRAQIDKIIAKCKAEIKVLKKDILDLLTDCYVKANAPELISKVESAVYHAFEGKVKILSDKDAGGVNGDCQIIGVIITHDKKKKFTTAKLIKAGAKNSQGVYLIRPQIVVYEYDKKQEEGIFRAETDEYKKKVKERKKSKTLTYLKGVYFNKNTLLSLAFTLIYALFAVWACVGGFADGCYLNLSLRYTAVIFSALSIITLATLKTAKRGGLMDMIPLTAVLVSIVGFACSVGYGDLFKALVFPSALLIYGVVALILRAKFANGKDDSDKFGLPVAIFLGVIVGFVFGKMAKGPSVYWITAISVFGVIFISSAVFAIVKKKTEFGKVCSYISIVGSVFCAVRLLFVPNVLVTVILAVVGAFLGLCPTILKLVEKDV
ncbi:MAG: hypothetical protein IJW64_01100 [Clostridia bacterium]|nr:hypothetical protein [Clostridia bacterium]